MVKSNYLVPHKPTEQVLSWFLKYRLLVDSSITNVMWEKFNFTHTGRCTICWVFGFILAEAQPLKPFHTMHIVQISTWAPHASPTNGTGPRSPVKQLRHGADHSPLSSAEVKNENSQTSALPLHLQNMLWGDDDLHTTHTFYPQQQVSFITELLPRITPVHHCTLRPHSTVYYLLPVARQPNWGSKEQCNFLWSVSLPGNGPNISHLNVILLLLQ